LAEAVQLNGKALQLDAEDDIPPLTGDPTSAGTTTLAPATITFLIIAGAANADCR